MTASIYPKCFSSHPPLNPFDCASNADFSSSSMDRAAFKSMFSTAFQVESIPESFAYCPRSRAFHSLLDVHIASFEAPVPEPLLMLYFLLLTQVKQVSLNVSVAVIGGPNTETMAKSLTASLSLLTSIIGNLGSVQPSQVHLYFDSDISGP
ncbi:hypothetical protein B0H10DRAFT_1961451 [Mycena sp. CBHHK59/15]|nr:hypothetical protein B0H10DRAFT_1961451 [Mycena sp. CBHHK59/15]